MEKRLLKNGLIKFVLKLIYGALSIYLVNLWFTEKGIEGLVGFNPISISIAGFLGVPGLILMFGSVYFFRHF